MLHHYNKKHLHIHFGHQTNLSNQGLFQILLFEDEFASDSGEQFAQLVSGPGQG